MRTKMRTQIDAFCDNCRFLRRAMVVFATGHGAFCGSFWQILANHGFLLLGWQSPLDPHPMPFTVSKHSSWNIERFIKVPIQLIICDELHSTSKLLLILLMNQVGFKPVHINAIDRCLGIHRSTRVRCLSELREYGFIKGTDAHLVLMDPIPILDKFRKDRIKVEAEIDDVMGFDEYYKKIEEKELTKAETVKPRNYLQEATDAWNRYRPKDYQKIRRISAQVIKAIDIHMKDLSVHAHNYDEFFSILKAGVEKSDFWSNQNTSKTLQSITGVGSPTDKKKLHVYALFNDGVSKPAAPTEEEERVDTIVFPARYRDLIDEYESAQTAYNEAYRSRTLTDDHRKYVVRTEQAIVDAKLNPAQFRFKFGIREWPTSVPEPVESRVVNWSFDDEYGNVY